MKKIIKSIAIVCCYFLLAGCMVQATEEGGIKAGTVLKTSEETILWDTPGKTGQELAILQAGDAVLVEEDCTGAWCKVTRGENSGYIEAEKLEQVVDQVALDKEFEQIDQQIEKKFEEVQVFESQRKQAVIWGSIIAVLVIAIFGVGIVSVWRKNKEENKQQHL